MSKRNQTIAIARFLAYKMQLNFKLDSMTDEDYLKNPVGLDVGAYVEDLMKYCSEETVDTVMRQQDKLISRLGETFLFVTANMPYEQEVTVNA